MLTRIAPTPSGYLHLGNILSFVTTAVLAEKVGATILLRIDDMDRERVNPLYVQDVFNTLRFLDIPWQMGPRSAKEFEAEWSQLHRMALYEAALLQLRESGQVFACTCSRAEVRRITGSEVYPGTCADKQISLDTPGASWRLHTQATDRLTVHDYYSGATTATLPPGVQYMVVRKKDGFPAYQLSSLVDDVYFGVNLIVRGQDLWPSTLAQQYLAQVLKLEVFQQVQFYHHQLLMDNDRLKLSKSSGSTSIKYLRELGRSPADVYTLISDMAGINQRAESWRQLAAHLA